MHWCGTQGIKAKPLHLLGYGDDGESEPAANGGGGCVNDFAHLLDRLAYEPRRNAKLRLLQDYFAHAPDPERGYALAAMTGGLTFREAKPAMIRGLVEARIDPVLFALSHKLRRRSRRDHGADLAGARADIRECRRLSRIRPASRVPSPGRRGTG